MFAFAVALAQLSRKALSAEEFIPALARKEQLYSEVYKDFKDFTQKARDFKVRDISGHARRGRALQEERMEAPQRERGAG